MPLPVERVVQEVDSLREAMKAVEVLAGLLLGGVVEGLRDVVWRAVQPVVPPPAPLSDRELSRRFAELTDRKTTLEAKLEKQRGSGGKTREDLTAEEEKLGR